MNKVAIDHTDGIINVYNGLIRLFIEQVAFK